MATIQEALSDRLMGLGDLVALVGSRMFDLYVPQGTDRPYLMYHRSGTPPRLASLQGPSGRAQPRFDFHILADSAASMRAVAQALRKGLDGYRGRHAAVEIGGMTLIDEREIYEIEVQAYHATQVFDVTHTED